MSPIDYYAAAAIVALVAIQSFQSAGRYDRTRGRCIFDIIAGIGLAVLAYRLWSAA